MSPKVAIILCIVLAIALLSIERKRNPTASYALWVPTFWILISGSRPVGRWFDASLVSSSGGSPIDQMVLSMIIIIVLFILSRRKLNLSMILKDNRLLILLFMYMGVSILWSDFPFISFKRWIRASAVILMALVVLSEESPLQALESILRRSAYVLIPFSIVLIKYFPLLGRQYDRWSGQLMWTGVAMQKNGLGQICTLSVFIIAWSMLREWRAGNLFKTRSQFFADALVFAIAVYLLIGPEGSYSATSIAVLIVGTFLLLLLYKKENLARYLAAHLKVFLVVSILIYLFLDNYLISIISSSFGRDESLTDRTYIWSMLLDIASLNPILGVGYGGFWGLPTKESSSLIVNQSHNGYLGVYLELGIVGIVMLSAFLLAFCGRVKREINHVFDWGVFGVCFTPMVLLYNYTENAFITSGYLWSVMIFIMIAFSASHPCFLNRRDYSKYINKS